MVLAHLRPESRLATAADTQYRHQAESPAERGWLSAFFGEDDNRRLWVALAAAIALHEIVAAIIPHGANTDALEKVQVSQLVRISVEHRATPTPKPPPTPRPVPRIISTPHPVIANVNNPAAAAPKAKAGLAKSIAHTHYHRPVVEHILIPKIHKAGAGLGSRGIGRGVVGTRGNGTGAGGQGNGTGSGGQGNGTGGYAAADEPCGFVEFVNIQTPRSDHGAFYQNIRMVVHYGNGTTQGYELDYPFYYPSEAAFPWSDQNIKNQDFPVAFQFPPADKRATEPPVVQYVMQHSTPAGLTTLKDCKGM